MEPRSTDPLLPKLDAAGVFPTWAAYAFLVWQG